MSTKVIDPLEEYLKRMDSIKEEKQFSKTTYTRDDIRANDFPFRNTKLGRIENLVFNPDWRILSVTPETDKNGNRTGGVVFSYSLMNDIRTMKEVKNEIMKACDNKPNFSESFLISKINDWCKELPNHYEEMIERYDIDAMLKHE